MWKTNTVGTVDNPATQSYLGSVVFVVLLVAALWFAFRRNRDTSDPAGQAAKIET
jgi:hypothetical protein